MTSLVLGDVIQKVVNTKWCEHTCITILFLYFKIRETMEVWYNALLVEKKKSLFFSTAYATQKEKEDNILKASQPGWSLDRGPGCNCQLRRA
jgi:hypothetical protein